MSLTAKANTGAGTDVLATDLISTTHYPKTKLAYGVDGVATDVTTSAGLPVGIVGTVPVSGTFWQATQPVSLAALPAGTATIGNVKVTDGTNFMPTADAAARAQFTKTTDGTNTAAVKAASTAPVATDPALVVAISPNSPAHPVTVSSGTVTTVSTVTSVSNIAAISAGANLIGDVALQARANATGSWTPIKIISQPTNNAFAAKASPGRVMGWSLYNAGAAVAYLKLYNKTTTPTVGTDATQMVVAIPAGQVVNFASDVGIGFTVGIGMALVTGPTDVDNTAVASAQIVGQFYYA